MSEDMKALEAEDIQESKWRKSIWKIEGCRLRIDLEMALKYKGV
jgi:hypothetical protein